MSKTELVKAATIPIQIVLYREEAGGDLKQRRLTDAERQQLRDRYAEIEASGDAARKAQFHQAFDHAEKHHPGDPEPLIVVSLSNGDEMTWQVLDQNGVEEPGFTVETPPQLGGPTNPFNGLPNPPGAATIVRSGHVKGTHLRHLYKFNVTAKDGKVFDPDWYAGD